MKLRPTHWSPECAFRLLNRVKSLNMDLPKVLMVAPYGNTRNTSVLNKQKNIYKNEWKYTFKQKKRGNSSNNLLRWLFKGREKEGRCLRIEIRKTIGRRVRGNSRRDRWRRQTKVTDCPRSTAQQPINNSPGICKRAPKENSKLQ